MSSSMNINQPGITAPTPQNTPLTHAPIAAGLSRPTVPDISEDAENDMENINESADVSELQGGAMQAALAGMVQSRLSTLVGRSSGYIESLDVDTKRSLEALKGVQVKQTDLQNQYKRECLELEKKYLELQKPLFERRHAIITAAATPTEEEIAAGEEASAKEDPDYTPLPKPEGGKPATKGIPEFWLTALRNHIGISELITERDEGALKHLVDIRLSYLPADAEKPGFMLSFVFDKNDYFENDVLTKTYVYQPEVGYSGDFLYDRAIGTEIKWKEDKDLTKEFEIKKQRNKNTNRTRLVRKAHPTDSFFNFFNPPVMPSDEAIENGDVEDEALEEIEERLEVDYQIGEDIKERIIPRAVDYFTGKALEYEDIDESDDEDFDDDDDEDAFEDDDSESDNDVPARRRGGPPKGRGAAADAAATNPEECKQQ